MNLQAFMAQNVEQLEVQGKVISPRFKEPKKDENGEVVKDEKGNIVMVPIKWQFAPITGDEEDAIRKLCTKKVQHPAKKGLLIPETDQALLTTKLTVASIKYPDLHNADLQDSYGVKSAEVLLGRMLLPGEAIEAKQFAQEINGYTVEFDDLVDEAKN